jgi:hypothetical protein
MDWTPLDLKNLAALFDDLADAVLSYRRLHGAALNDAQKRQLTTQFGQLISRAETLEEMAVSGALSDVGTDVKDLQSASHDAIQALQTVANVQKAIAIAVAAVAVGAAIVAPSPSTIGPALGLLVKTVKDANALPADAAAVESKAKA